MSWSPRWVKLGEVRLGRSSGSDHTRKRSECDLCTDQVPPKSVSWRQLFTKTREEKEVGYVGKPARKFDKQNYIFDVNRSIDRQADKKRKAKQSVPAPSKGWALAEEVYNNHLLLSGSAATAEIVAWEPHPFWVSTLTQ